MGLNTLFTTPMPDQLPVTPPGEVGKVSSGEKRHIVVSPGMGGAVPGDTVTVKVTGVPMQSGAVCGVTVKVATCVVNTVMTGVLMLPEPAPGIPIPGLLFVQLKVAPAVPLNTTIRF